MLTAAGWKLLAAAVLLLVAGRLFAVVEFHVAGAAAAATVTLCLLVRLVHPSRLALRRDAPVSAVPIGETVQVRVHLRNLGVVRSPVVLLADAVTASGGLTQHKVFHVPPLGGRRSGGSGRGRVAYEITPGRRGVLTLGPVRIEDQDPLGLACRRMVVGARSRLVVHPPIEDIDPSRLIGAGDGSAEFGSRRVPDPASEDFDGLRTYAVGDDPRLIHWPSSARLAELMVRQFRPPAGEAEVNVVVDTRPPGNTEAAGDCTLSVAASLVAAALRTGARARILTTDGRSTPRLLGRADLRVGLEFCAVLTGGDDQLRIEPGATRDGSATVAITASPEAIAHREVRSRLAARLGAGVLITCDVRNWNDPEASSGPISSGAWVHLSAAGQLQSLFARRAVGDNTTRL